MSSEFVYQQQTPIKGTIAGMVPPGNETGYYYIPVANLPWQTSWQQLKDHVRTVCSVERVEIHEDITCGHVVLKGRENFDAAFRLLNGGVFNGRPLMACGKNVDQWVLVKQHVDGLGSSPKSPKTSRHTTPPTQYTSSHMPPASSGYSERPANTPTTSYMMSPVITSSSYPVPSTMSYNHRDPAAFYGMGSCSLEYSSAMAASSIPYLSGAGYTQHYATSEHQGTSYSMPSGYTIPHEGNRTFIDVVPTRRRKIIIRQLQPWATYTQILDLIRYKAGADAERLQKLDLPLADGRKGVNRGYALATFETEEAAEKVIKKLHNYKYDGQVLEAKHTKEGVSDYEATQGSRSNNSAHQHHSHHSRREHRDDKDRKGKEKESSSKASSSGEKKSKSSSYKSDVIIAHGSSSSSKYHKDKG
ncbi:hypothetical protein F5Y19DRAFT_135172 [Xylariaceae sp. FL1651]|nr:hypothetical protein F5Y19DRAFT_135172 [Xylariaceae sp. FL1651]